MLRLLLLRHGKSSWSDPDQKEHDRPLNDRGRLAARVMGGFMADNGLTPDHVLVSTATRTRQTWELIQPLLGDGPQATAARALYLAAPDVILQTLRTAPKKAQSVLLVGHQPGLGAFARKAANGSVKAGSARAFEDFPTCGLATLEFDEKNWSRIDFGKATFTGFTRPKDLV